MNCPKCGAEGLTGLYCSNCGSKLTDADDTKQENGNKEDLFYPSDAKSKEKGLAKYKKYWIIYWISIVFVILVAIAYYQSDNVVEARIKSGFDLIDQQKYDDAIDIFIGYYEDPTLEPLYYYAEGVKYLSEGDYRMAKSYADDINDYNGIGMERIEAFKNQVAKEATPEKLAQQEAQEKAVKKSEGDYRESFSAVDSLTSDQKIKAWVAAENYVKKYLKSPSSADFPWYSENYVTVQDGEIVVSAYVDAENSFGAKLRVPFICTMERDYDLIDISLIE